MSIEFDNDGSVFGWRIIVFGDCQHVLPVDEEERHFPKGCACNPTPDADDEKVIVHHSFDGREDFETGARKPS